MNAASMAEGTCAEAHALRLLVTAVGRGYTVEATRQGGAVIVREVRSGGLAPGRHTVTLEPLAPAGRLTEAVRRDLDAVGRHAGSFLAGGRIHVGLYTGPPAPAAAARLVQRALVTATGTAVTVSPAARLALLAAGLGLAGLPAGLNKPGGRSGKPYDGTSAASGSCRRWSIWAEDRGLAAEHRQQPAAAMLRQLQNGG